MNIDMKEIHEIASKIYIGQELTIEDRKKVINFITTVEVFIDRFLLVEAVA